MSKKPKKTTPRSAPKATSRALAKTATKGPARSLDGATAERIAIALEAIAGHLSAAAPAALTLESFGSADAFVWHPDGRLSPVPRVSRVDLGLLKGIDRMRDILIENTERFADGLPANNALLWGARGMGKSSLVKAAHANINIDRKPADRLKLIEIHREDIESLPGLMDLLRSSDFRFIVFCDDLSFDGNDASYKSLKAVLEGGIEGRPDNVILYATSNRRHLLAREMIENERSRRRCRCRTALGSGSASIAAARTNTSRWCAAIAAISASGWMTKRWSARRWNGQPPAARGRGAWPGSSRRSWRGGWACGFRGSRGQRSPGAAQRAAMRCRTGVQLHGYTPWVPAQRRSVLGRCFASPGLHCVRDTSELSPVQKLQRVNR
jgi:predicted AAA+ superfamily ATPase